MKDFQGIDIYYWVKFLYELCVNIFKKDSYLLLKCRKPDFLGMLFWYLLQEKSKSVATYFEKKFSFKIGGISKIFLPPSLALLLALVFQSG